MSKRESEADIARRERKRQRKSRWGGEDIDKAFIPGMPTILPGNLSGSQERAYLLQLQIEETSRRLRTGDLGITPNPEERSPSPEPIYNNEGKRLNTREYRTRKKLEEERHSLIQEMIDVNPEYKPPMDYKPPIVRVSDKVMIPQDDHPEINFVGLLIGPRGNTLKSMEKDTGAKIIIRGKGSVKEGKVGRKDGQPLPGEDEPLHAYVTAHNPESVKKAVDKIKDILRQGIEVPEGQNDLRRMQLRELALLNGTLRENEGPKCSNCGAATHKSWQCPDKPNVTNNIICTSCGGAGHIAKDCMERRTGTALSGTAPPAATNGTKAKIDEEYMSLMAELGEGPAPKVASGPSTNASQTNILASPQGPIRAIMAPPPQPALTNPPPHASITPPPWQAPRPGTPSAAIVPAGPTPAPPLAPVSIGGAFIAPPPPPPPAVGIMYPPWQQQLNSSQPLQVSQPITMITQVQTSTPPITNISSTMLGVATPAAILAQPPPPPPPPVGANITTSQQQQPVSTAAPAATTQISSWPTPQQPVMAPLLMPPWQHLGNPTMTPAPVPPPRMAGPPIPASSANVQTIPPWQQFMGLPPPTSGVQPPIPGTVAPPPPPPIVNTTATVAPVDLNTLAGLSGLLTAPPPPPPS